MLAAAVQNEFTTREAAAAVGIFDWQARRLYARGKLPEPIRFGPYRLIRREDLPALRQAAIEAGYLTEAAAAD